MNTSCLDTNSLNISANRFVKIQKAKSDIIATMIQNGADAPLNEFTVMDYGFGDELTRDIIVTCILENIEDDCVERDEVEIYASIEYVVDQYVVSLPNRFQWFMPGWFEVYREVELDIYSGMVVESGSLPSEYIETSVIHGEKFPNSDQLATFVEWMVSDLKKKGWVVEPCFNSVIAYHGIPILDASSGGTHISNHRFHAGLPETTKEIVESILTSSYEALGGTYKNTTRGDLSIHEIQSVTLFLKPQ